jgi:hypothetical protein
MSIRTEKSALKYYNLTTKRIVFISLICALRLRLFELRHVIVQGRAICTID